MTLLATFPISWIFPDHNYGFLFDWLFEAEVRALAAATWLAAIVFLLCLLFGRRISARQRSWLWLRDLRIGDPVSDNPEKALAGSRSMRLRCRLLFAAILALLYLSASTVADDWPQWRGPNRDAVWNETGVLQNFPADGLKVRWRVPCGLGFASPVVAGGRVFLTDAVLNKPKATERVHAFDEATGNKLWTHEYDVKYRDSAFDPAYPMGPVGTPLVADGRIYAGGSAGNFLCLDVASGNVVWERDLQKEFPGLDSYASPSPLIEGDLVIAHVGIKPAASVMAFHKDTGRDAWRALDAGATASSPIVITAAGVRQLIVWTEKTVTALNPSTGKTLWEFKLNTTQDAAVSTPVYRDGRLLIGGLMMQMDQSKPGADVLWPKSRATARRVLSDTSTAILTGDHVYSARSLGTFVCLEAGTGKQLWETDKVTDQKSGASVHITTHGETALLYNDRGELIRAKLAPDGYHELSRARVLEPAFTFSGRKTAWAVPAFANRHIFARTHVELVCASLVDEGK